MTTRALIVVDVQNDFISGTLPVTDGEQVAHRVHDLVEKEGIEQNYDFIVTTQDWHKDPGSHWAPQGTEPDFKDSWPVHCASGTWGAQLHTDLVDLNFDARFFKGHYEAAYSGFQGTTSPEGSGSRGTKLQVWLREHNVTDVDVVGLALDYCVAATAMDARGYGYNTRVLVPFTGAVAPASADAAIKAMKAVRIEVVDPAQVQE